MDLAALADLAPVRMKAFPPGRRGVLIPPTDRPAAALGICLYTASKPWVVTLQVGAYWLVRLLGARGLPGRTERWEPPCTAEEWRALVDQWQGQIGRLDALAVYQRRQTDRPGLTLVVTRDSARVAVIKVRGDGAGLGREQRALAAVQSARPRTFRSPRPMGAGSVSGWHWSAQEAVFGSPHRPVLRADPVLFDDVRRVLTDLVDGAGGEGVPAHRDLTPWNLRRDTAGDVWLFDWEDYGPAPVGADRAYFTAAAAALGGGRVPADLAPEAVAYCRMLIGDREATNPQDAKLAERMMAALAAGETDAADAGRRSDDRRPT